MKKHSQLIAAGMLLAALSPSQTTAAVNTWNNGSNDFLWNATSANWTAPAAWVDGDDAIFGATGLGAVTLGAPVAAQSLTFNAVGYVINGGGYPLTLQGTTPGITTSGKTTIASSIDGTSGLTVQGPSELWLVGDAADANHYTGGTFVKSGTLVLKAQKATSGGATWGIDSLEAVDAGATVKLGTTAVVLSGTNNYDRAVNGQIPVGGSVAVHNLNLTGGTVDLNGDDNQNQLPMPSGEGTIINSSPLSRAVLKFTGYNDERTFSGVIMDGGPVTNSIISGKLAHRTEVDFQSGGGTLILSGSNSFSGFVRIGAGGTIQLSGAGTLGYPTSINCPGRHLIHNNGLLDLNGTSQIVGQYGGGSGGTIANNAPGTLSTLTVCVNCTNSVIQTFTGKVVDSTTGSGGILGLTKVGPTPQVFTGGPNTYSGDTIVSGGILSFAAAAAVSPNTTIRLFTSAGNLNLNYAGDATVKRLYIDGVQMAPGTYDATTAPITGTGTITVLPPNTWNNASGDFLWNLTSGNWTTTPWVDGDDAVFGAAGAGTVSLGSPVTAQNISFTAPGYTIAGNSYPLTMVGGSPTITAMANTAITASIQGSNGLTIRGTGQLTLLGDTAEANHYTGGTYIRGGTVILNAGAANTGGTGYAVDSIEALDTGATVKIGTTLNGSSWSSVRDQIGVGSSAANSRLKLTGGTFDLNNDPKNQRIPCPDGFGTIINNGSSVQAGLVIIMDGKNHTFSGVIADGGPITTTPSGQGPGYQIGLVNLSAGPGGVLTLSGRNTYSGSTRLSAGSIKLEGQGTLGSPSLVPGVTGPLRVYGPYYLDLNGTSQTIGVMTDGNSGGMIYNTAVGTVSTLNFGYGPNTNACSYQFMDNPGTGGVLALNKIGTGAQQLKGVCTYSGDTTVTEGVLVISTTTAVATNSTIRLSATKGTLALTYTGTATVKRLVIDGVEMPNGVYGASTAPITGTGFIQVTASVGRPTLAFTQSAGALNFTWTGSYKLQFQANPLSVGLSNNWLDYPGGATGSISVPVDHSKGSVSFRLAPIQ